MRLRYGALLLFATTLAGCKSRQALAPNQAEEAARSLYKQVLARHPVGIPGDADIKAFSPYLSHGLLESINASSVCMKNWYARNPGPDSKPEVSWDQLRLFAGDTFAGDKRAEPEDFKIEKTEVEKDGSVLVSLKIARKESPEYTSTTHVAVILIEERGRYAVDDVIYLSEHSRWLDDHTQQTYTTEDARLSQYLSVGCGPPAKLVQSLYTGVMTRHPQDNAASEDWTVFAPYLSQALQHKIDVAKDCSEDWDLQNPYPPLKVPRPSAASFVSNRDGFSDPTSFQLQLTQSENDGSLRMYVNLTRKQNPPERNYSWRVALPMIQEGGRYVVDDVLYVNDGDWDGYPAGMPAERRFSGYLAAGCEGPHWIRNSLPNDPKALMQSFYTQIVARKPAGVPSGEDWKVFAPYLSRSLLHKIDVYEACMAGEDREMAKSDVSEKPSGLYEDGIFTGSNELAGPDDFHIESTQPQKNGSVRVTTVLHWSDYMYRHDTLTWRVADILVQEMGHYVLDDVIFLKDKKLNIDSDYTLTKILSMSPECDGRRWVGYRGTNASR